MILSSDLSVIGIEAACHAFVDIFNQTYRNYFCYMCNTDNPEPPELLSCKQQSDSGETAYSMDLSIDLISKIEDGSVLGCDPETQFVDLKQVGQVREPGYILHNFKPGFAELSIRCFDL